MHADLSKEIQGKVVGGIRANQVVINEWVKEYNEVRPHEALDMKTPSDIYSKSKITYDELSCDYEYPFGFETKKINKSGSIKIKRNYYYISSALSYLKIGMEYKNDNEYLVWLHSYPVRNTRFKISLFKTGK